MPARLQLLEELMNTVIKIHRYFDQFSTVSLEEKVATILQMQALKFLSTSPDATAGKLAESLHLSSSSCAQLIERLEQAKWIQRTHDKKDRRMIHLSVTTEGSQKLEQLKQLRYEKLRKIFSHLSEDDIKKLVDINKKLLQSLDKAHYEKHIQ